MEYFFVSEKFSFRLRDSAAAQELFAASESLLPCNFIQHLSFDALVGGQAQVFFGNSPHRHMANAEIRSYLSGTAVGTRPTLLRADKLIDTLNVVTAASCSRPTAAFLTLNRRSSAVNTFAHLF